MLLSLTVVLDYFVPTDAKRRLPNAAGVFQRMYGAQYYFTTTLVALLP